MANDFDDWGSLQQYSEYPEYYEAPEPDWSSLQQYSEYPEYYAEPGAITPEAIDLFSGYESPPPMYDETWWQPPEPVYEPEPTWLSTDEQELMRELELARLAGAGTTQADQVPTWVRGTPPETQTFTIRPGQTAEQAQYGATTQQRPAMTARGALSNIGARLASGDLNAWLTLLGEAGNIYSRMQTGKAARKAAESAAKLAQARAARFEAPLPRLRLQRQQLAAPADLLTAGMRPGGIQWFTQPQFVEMAEGGKVEADDGWLDRALRALRRRRAAPELTGAGTAARAGKELESRPYRIYRAEMQALGEEPLSQEEWGSRRKAKGGSNYVKGSSPGQKDDVNAKLSHGEYVFDADSVSALGDGNNAAGAERLDEMRRRLRAHKRKAPPERIPPKAKKPEAYLKKR